MFQQYPIITAILVVAACAVLNRVRGGGFYGDKLPGRAVLWVSAAIGGIAYLVHPQDWRIAVAFGTGFLFWGLWSWGYAFAGLGGYKPERAPSTLEAFLMLFGPAVVQTFVRHMFVIVAIGAVAWLLGSWWFLVAAPVFAAAATAVYTILFRPISNLDWTRAEIATGALWGCLILSPWVLR